MDAAGWTKFIFAGMAALGTVQAAYGLWRGDLVFAALGALYAVVGVGTVFHER